MDRDASSPQPSGLSRRALLSAAGAAVAAGPLLAGCGSGGRSKGPGTTSQSELTKALPAYLPNGSIKPDVASVTGTHGAISDPVFLTYPADPVTTVGAAPGKGGHYTAMTPLWGSIPPSNGNAYYDAVDKALGATLKMQPADGNNYGNVLPGLLASNKVPDWINIPGWYNATLKLGEAVGSKFVDLTPYLAGDQIRQYPNLAAIPSGAWQTGIWNGKLYGIPVYPSGANFTGTFFYRDDVLRKLGIDPSGIKTPTDLTNLGKELTGGGRWAFGDLYGNMAAYTGQIFGFPHAGHWTTDASGKLVNRYETEGLKEALNWQAALTKAGYVHPDAVAGNNQNQDQLFWSGKMVIVSGGTGAWVGNDAKSGTAANPEYNRQAFKLLSVDGKNPSIELTNSAAMSSYLNARLSDAQIKELLAIANYIAAPYGSKEWLLVNNGPEGIDYEMQAGNPVLTAKGAKEVATTFQFLVSPVTPTTVQSGFTQVAKDYNAWQQDTVKHAVKPMFFGMNITEPAQYASIAQPVEDTITDIKVGRKPVSALDDAVKAWREKGGDALRTFYDGIRQKYGDGRS